MPRVVDSDQRRTELIAATSQEIARHGLGNVTLRSIARVGGWSTGIVTHYFADKQSLLMATYRERADRSRRHIEQEVANGATLLEAAVDAALPLDSERRLDWRVFLAYMGSSIGSDELSALHSKRMLSFRDTLRDALAAEATAGRIAASADPEHEAASLLVVLNGVAVQAVLSPQLWPAAAQRRVVDEHLATLRVKSKRRAK